jgi:hypothetical protein
VISVSIIFLLWFGLVRFGSDWFRAKDAKGAKDATEVEDDLGTSVGSPFVGNSVGAHG